MGKNKKKEIKIKEVVNGDVTVTMNAEDFRAMVTIVSCIGDADNFSLAKIAAVEMNNEYDLMDVLIELVKKIGDIDKILNVAKKCDAYIAVSELNAMKSLIEDDFK